MMISTWLWQPAWESETWLYLYAPRDLSPFTAVTITWAPASTGTVAIASQYSPRTNTFPPGDSGVSAWPTSPTIPISPVTTFALRARITRLTRKMVISAKGNVTAMAVARLILISGGPSIKSSAPRTIATAPPMPRMPCEGSWLRGQTAPGPERSMRLQPS